MLQAYSSLSACACLGLKFVDQIDDVEEPAAFAVTDTGTGNCDGEMCLAGTSAADQHCVALMCQEVATGKVAHKGLVDRSVIEGEVVDILGQRQLGDADLVADRACLLLSDLRRQQIADNMLRFMLTLHRRGGDLVERRLHAVELQLRHGGEELGTLHHTALLMLS